MRDGTGERLQIVVWNDVLQTMDDDSLVFTKKHKYGMPILFFHIKSYYKSLNTCGPLTFT